MLEGNKRPKLRSRVARARRAKRWVAIPEPVVPETASDKLRRLEQDFRADPNPLFIWQAIALMGELQTALPVWVADYLSKAAANITSLFGRVIDGQPVGREPEQVGKALGFGLMGPGRGGYFERAKLQERDRRVYVEVQAELDDGKDIREAYRLAALFFELRYSEVEKIHKKLRKLMTGRTNVR